jgi:chemotaxis response regulator CheB
MFESVARSYGERAIGVVLSGSGADAALGSLAMAHAGGVVVAQEEGTCRFPGMPAAAVKVGAAARKLSPAEIAQALRDWAQEPAGAATASLPTPLEAARTINVLLVDDHRIILDGLRVLLESQPDMKVVGTANDGASALRLAERAAPDVVVMDIRLPGLGGVETTERLLARVPSAKVLALSAESDSRSVNGIFRAGAAGYLSKHRAFGELVQAIRTVMLGGTYLSPEAARLVAQGLILPPQPRSA